MSRVCKRCSYENGDEAKFCRECGGMLEIEFDDPENPLLGKIVLSRYRVTKLIGEGGMGKVYLAQQKMGNAVRKVAIKTLHSELNRDPQLVARFHRECETVIELTHPNTVKFYDFGALEDETLVLVMEYIKGDSLATILDRGPISPDRISRILIQICGSLQEAHDRGVVHRDLKPENILLTTRGGQTDFVKVLDFGIAKRSEAEDKAAQKLTKQGTVLGTPPYMSPEQFSGQPLDGRSDIYSLGTITFEMVTGRLPFEASTPWEWATKHLTAAPAPLHNFPEGARLSPARQAAVMRCLSKDPAQRPSTTTDFMKEFTGVQDASSAWTYATAPGVGSLSPPPSNPALSPPYGHSGPLAAPGASMSGPPSSGSSPSIPAVSQPGFLTPPQGHATPPPMHSQAGNRAHLPKTTPLNLSVSGATPSLPVPTPAGGFAGVHPPAYGAQKKKNKGPLLFLLAGLFVVGGGGTAAVVLLGLGPGSGSLGVADALVPLPTPLLPLRRDASIGVYPYVQPDAAAVVPLNIPDAAVVEDTPRTPRQPDSTPQVSAAQTRRARQSLEQASSSLAARDRARRGEAFGRREAHLGRPRRSGAPCAGRPGTAWIHPHRPTH